MLSVMAMAATSASAYDQFIPGTDEAPNYYLIRTERGNPFLSYSAEGVSNSAEGYVSHLTRLVNATEASLWEVTPGSETGTVVIKNYVGDFYLMNLSTTPADVTETATNIYVQQLTDKAFSIGVATSGTNFLDANNWNNNCGFWSANDGGTTWYATKVDLTNADDVLSAIQAAQYGSDCESAQKHAIAQLEAYAGVEVVADVIAEGVEAIKSVKSTSDFQTNIDAALQDTWTKAAAMLGTGLNGKTFGILNLRREGTDNAYVSVNTTTNNYPGAINMIDGNVIFEFQSVETGGYHIYNKATSTYMSVGGAITDIFTPTQNESDATAVFPFLNSFDSYSGITFALKAERSQYEGTFNYDPSSQNGALVVWYADTDGAGSIWNIIEFNEETVVKNITAPYISHLTEYATNVEPAANIFNAGITKLGELSLSSTIVAEAAAIETETLAFANEFLKAGLNEKSVQLRSLRNGYIIPNEVPSQWTISEGVTEETYGYSISTTATDAANYDFVSGAEGGYTVYSPVTERYFGPFKQNGGNKSIPQVDKADAALVYPVLYHNGDFYGVAFPLTDSDAAGTAGLNTNSTGLHQYQINDIGSIFAIKIMGNATEIAEISASAPSTQGIYDLSGRKLSAPVRGINIINGRKVLVK